MDKEALKNYVNIMQMALDKIGELIDESEQSPICEHPPGMRRDLSTMGHISWECRQCGHLYEQPLEAGTDGQIRSD